MTKIFTYFLLAIQTGSYPLIWRWKKQGRNRWAERLCQQWEVPVSNYDIESLAGSTVILGHPCTILRDSTLKHKSGWIPSHRASQKLSTAWFDSKSNFHESGGIYPRFYNILHKPNPTQTPSSKRKFRCMSVHAITSSRNAPRSDLPSKGLKTCVFDESLKNS